MKNTIISLLYLIFLCTNSAYGALLVPEGKAILQNWRQIFGESLQWDEEKKRIPGEPSADGVAGLGRYKPSILEKLVRSIVSLSPCNNCSPVEFNMIHINSKNRPNELEPGSIIAHIPNIHEMQYIDLEDVLEGLPQDTKNELLSSAVLYGLPCFTRCLLKHGADSNIRDAHDATPLMGVVARTTYFGQRGRELPRYITESIWPVIIALLEHGIDHQQSDRDGNTSLHYFMQKDIPEELLIPLLDKYPWAIHARNNDQESALHLAVQTNKIAVVEWLLKQKVGVDALDNKGRTPLMYAAYQNNPKMMQLLIDYGADLAACDIAGNTVLHYCAAIKGSNPEVLCILDTVRWNVNTGNDVGETPLHYAAFTRPHSSPYKDYENASTKSYDNIIFARWLLDHGADVEIRDNAGKRPIDYVCTKYRHAHGDAMRALIGGKVCIVS